MNLSVTKLDDLSHPLVNSAYLKRDHHGNILIIETDLDGTQNHHQRDSLENLLVDLNGLIDEIERDIMHLDLIDIRLRAKDKKEPFAACGR